MCLMIKAAQLCVCLPNMGRARCAMCGKGSLHMLTDTCTARPRTTQQDAFKSWKGDGAMETSLWEAEVSLPGVWHREVNQSSLYVSLLLRSLHRDLPTWPSARGCPSPTCGVSFPTGVCIFVFVEFIYLYDFSCFYPQVNF